MYYYKSLCDCLKIPAILHDDKNLTQHRKWIKRMKDHYFRYSKCARKADADPVWSSRRKPHKIVF